MRVRTAAMMVVLGVAALDTKGKGNLPVGGSHTVPMTPHAVTHSGLGGQCDSAHVKCHHDNNRGQGRCTPGCTFQCPY
ncbi:hypothetical protein BJV78DRAFT_1253387 [Lactifluus subvellereus]|nr:hypothetical protein BJV78DRAFT_1253387 [Lactifluus subvellereus]